MIPSKEVQILSGSESLMFKGKSLDENVLSFWRWSSSEILGNALRGILAEYIVAIDLGANPPCVVNGTHTI